MAEFVYAMGMMSAVALSWGILLLMADRIPVERRWILLPTAIVVALLTSVRIYASLNGMVEFRVVFLLLGILILSLLIYSYIISESLRPGN